MILSNLQPAELLRHVVAIGADCDPLIKALSDALRECDADEVERLQKENTRLEEELEEREAEAREDGWQHGLEVARRLLDFELDASEPNDSVSAAFVRLDHALEQAADDDSDQYVFPKSLPTREATKARSNVRRAMKNRAPNPAASVVVTGEPIEAPVAGAGKHQRLLVAYLQKVKVAKSQDLRTHLMRVGGVSLTGAYGVLDRAIKAGLLEVLDGGRVALAPIVPTD